MNITTIINQEKPYLPWIRPLRSFIHFHMFPDLVATPFWMALEELDLIYAWSSLLPDDYWRMFHELNWVSITPAARPQSAKEDKSDPLIKEKGFRPIHQLVNQKIKTSLNELTEPILIRYLSAYFDQGFAYRSPTIKSEGLLASFVHFIEESLIPVKPFKKKHLQKWKLKSAEELAQELLYDILPYPDYHHQYIREILISLKGWSGMIKTAEANPHLLPIPRKANLLDFVTIRLMIEWSWLKNYLGFPQITKEELKTAVGALQRDIPSRQKQHLLIDLEKNIQRRYLPSLKNCLNDYAPTTAQAEWSFVFCIDDRECILRRHLENQDPRIQTFGTPGFFGFEFFLRRHDHEHLIKQCPDPVKTDKIIKLKQDLQQNTYPWTTPKWSNLSALKSLFFIKTPKYKNTHLRLIRFEKAPPFDARTAFSLEEAALRIAQIFKSMGWSRITTSLNFIIGHHEFFLSPSERGGIGVFDFTKIKRLLVTRSSFFLSFSGLLFIVLAFGFTNMNLPLTFGLLTMAAASLLCLKAIFSYDTVKSSHLQQLVSTTLFVLGTWLSLGHLSLGLLSFCCLIAIAFFLSFWALSPYFNYPLHTFHGAKYVGINRYRVMVVSFLIAAGYPLTPMFIAEDSLYSELLHVSITHTLLAFTYLLLLAIYWMRLMVKVFWGFHYKALIHPVFPPLYPSSKYK